MHAPRQPRRTEDLEPDPRVPRRREDAPEPHGRMSPAALLALQRSGAGNHALSRVLARNGGDKEEGQAESESEEDEGGTLLLTDRPWDEIVASTPIPRPMPLLELELPIVIPLASIPAGYRWMFGIAEPDEPPAAPLMIEYKPVVEEQEAEEPPPAPEPVVEAPAAKKKRKRKKKGAATTEGAETAPPKSQVKPPPAPPKKALHELSLDELEAEIMGPKKKEKPPPKAPQEPKKSKAQKLAEKQLAERRRKQQEDEARAEREQREREKAELLKETQARVNLIKVLGALKSKLEAARDALPDDADHDAIYTEADTGVGDLKAYLAGPGKTADSTALNAKAAELNKLISKVTNFTPPETPEQRRARRWEEIKVNVGLAFAREAWTGPKGGQADFTVDKRDTRMRDLIRGYYGTDDNEVPGHADKQYPGKTKTSKVYYYVTWTSNTAGIAYDISLHAWDGDKQIGTVHVLHIPHKEE